MKSTQRKVSGAPLPARREGFVFALKAWILRRKRSLQNSTQGISKHLPGKMENARLLSESVSPLWTGEDTAQGLIAGKIQNLRLAAKRLDGVVVPAGQVFSFWKQVGRLTRRRGYARGRELREGCIIPTIGGGICQLSNAIYDAAVEARFEIVERHSHSQVIPGSLAEKDRDATVFWNYIDLRLRAPYPWLLRVKMDYKYLTVQILSSHPAAQPAEREQKKKSPDAIGDCSRCGRTDCYLHTGDIPLHDHKTWLVIDEEWPEFALWRKQHKKDGDKVISTIPTDGVTPHYGTRWVNFRSKLIRRNHVRRRHPLPIGHNSRFSRLAHHFGQKLNETDTHLVVPQNLLPWLWMNGELRGRQYDVFMNAIPISDIQRRLDEGVRLYPQITTLSDHRANPVLEQAERDALEGARSWITPHWEILRAAGKKGVALPWLLPKTEASPLEKRAGTPQIMLAASPLARKGIFELREAIRTLSTPVQLILPPGAMERPDFRDGFNVRTAPSMAEGIRDADVVVLPAWVEHQTRGLLMAIALGKPVIATPACGLPDDMPWTPVRPGHTDELREAISEAIRMKIP